MTSPIAAPDFSCPTCQDTFWWTGDTPTKRAAALAAWRCACTPEPPREDAVADMQTGERPRAGHTLLNLFIRNPKGIPDGEHREGPQGLLLDAREAGRQQGDGDLLAVPLGGREGVLPGGGAVVALAPGHIFAPAPRRKWLGFLLTAVAPCMALWLGGGYLAVRSITQ